MQSNSLHPHQKQLPLQHFKARHTFVIPSHPFYSPKQCAYTLISKLYFSYKSQFTRWRWGAQNRGCMAIKVQHLPKFHSCQNTPQHCRLWLGKNNLCTRRHRSVLWPLAFCRSSTTFQCVTRNAEIGRGHPYGLDSDKRIYPTFSYYSQKDSFWPHSQFARTSDEAAKKIVGAFQEMFFFFLALSNLDKRGVPSSWLECQPRKKAVQLAIHTQAVLDELGTVCPKDIVRALSRPPSRYNLVDEMVPQLLSKCAQRPEEEWCVSTLRDPCRKPRENTQDSTGDLWTVLVKTCSKSLFCMTSYIDKANFLTQGMFPNKMCVSFKKRQEITCQRSIASFTNRMQQHCQEVLHRSIQLFFWPFQAFGVELLAKDEHHIIVALCRATWRDATGCASGALTHITGAFDQNLHNGSVVNFQPPTALTATQPDGMFISSFLSARSVTK